MQIGKKRKRANSKNWRPLVTLDRSKSIAFIREPWKYLTRVCWRLSRPSNSRSGSALKWMKLIVIMHFWFCKSMSKQKPFSLKQSSFWCKLCLLDLKWMENKGNTYIYWLIMNSSLHQNFLYSISITNFIIELC